MKIQIISLLAAQFARATQLVYIKLIKIINTYFRLERVIVVLDSWSMGHALGFVPFHHAWTLKR
jgi:hypothetical protein